MILTGGYCGGNGALKCAATLRTRSAGAQDESRCSAIHKIKGKVKGNGSFAGFWARIG
jgi:hypothetical protein